MKPKLFLIQFLIWNFQVPIHLVLFHVIEKKTQDGLGVGSDCKDTADEEDGTLGCSLGVANQGLEAFVVVVQLLSHVRLFATPWTAACQASLSFTISQSLLKLMSIESVMPSNHLSLCHPLLFVPSIVSSIRVFSNESAPLIMWPKCWSFSISLSQEYSGFISFRIDWFDLLAVQGTLKSLFQHHSSKASVLWHPAFFMVQLSHHPYMTIGKTVALTIQTFVGKVMSLLFHTSAFWKPQPELAEAPEEVSFL